MADRTRDSISLSGYSGAAIDFSSESEMLEGRYKPAVDMNKHFDPSERLSEQYIPRAPSHDEPPSYTTAANVRVRGHRRTSTIHEIPDSPSKEYERKEWGSKAEFLLSCLSYSVGIGSIWRFPFLAHQHGGGAFLIPYSILLILVGTPMYYMETAMGQFSRLSCLQVWRSTPLCTGVGVGMLVLSLIKVIHTTTLMAYSIVYFVSSIQGAGDEVPWVYCGSWWGSSENCIALNSSLTPDQTLARTDNKCIFSMETDCSNLKTSVEEYWLEYVLGIGRGLHEFGDVGNWRYHLPLSLLLAWIFIFICIIKGTASSGKAVYVTGLLPYAALISLLARSLTLPGGFQGIQLFFKPDWEQLKNPMVWKIAAEEQFYSLGITYGVLFMLGSHNKFKNKVHIDSSILPTLHFSTYILTRDCIDTKHVLREAADYKFDPALAFIIYPQSAVSAVYDGIPILSLHKVFIKRFF
ncbi:sodium-dependent proline transporter-like [Eurytemora carolleeae]|uniref:sodium-dependent proline transporter-like n=1 Tax=Eurytemora carolleeae TaxID=1294199 RepID=UPI000C78BD12|nr:sodium-dependent proline transporter-like [Eurytemora carolleeae]|eukprot:XP_023344928.1 sodium-dependent proline transporter-like [Eurytemora affinis]